MVAQVILVDAQPFDPATGAIVAAKLAGAGGARPYFYADQHWRAGIAALPASVASLDFDGLQLGGGGVPQALELGWSPASRDALSDMAALYWTDAPIVVRIGVESDALPPVTTAGLVLGASVEGGVLKIALADAAADLKRPLLVDRYAGTGGIEGPVEWTNLIRSRAWGRCWNVPGKVIDVANNITCFGDTRRPWSSIDDVRDRGVSAGAALTTLAWQGSAAATFAALQAAVAPIGGGVCCPSIACVKWWTTPAGDLHADIHGEMAGGYVETAPDIAARIVAARSALVFGAGEVASAAAARPAPFGWRCDSEAMTAARAISDILGDVGLSWVLVDGAIGFRRWEWTAPARVARSVSATRRELVKPVATRRVGYRRNQAPMARGDLAAVVLARDVLLTDGTTVEGAIAAYDASIADALAAADAAAVLADGKIETFYQANPPAGASVGDLWFDSDDGNRLYRHDGNGWQPAVDAKLGEAITAAAGAQATADGRVSTFYGAEEPVANAVGDLWYDSTGKRLLRWNGGDWVSVSTFGATAEQVDAIAAATDAADAAATLADGKTETFYQAAPPTDASVGDLWFDTDDGNRLYRHDGNGWQPATDAKLAEAITAAAGAQATADGRVSTFYGSNAPVANALGDLWYNFATLELRRWSGDAWVTVATIGATQDQIDLIELAYVSGSSALATADGKITTFYQSGVPPVADYGDLWFDTDDGYKQYLHNGIEWVTATDARLGQAINAAAGAQATADGKVTTFYSVQEPVAEGDGDLWINIATNQMARWNTVDWVPFSTVPDSSIETKHIHASAVQKTSFAILGGDVSVARGQTQPVLSLPFSKDEAASPLKLQFFGMFWSADDLQFSGAFVVDDSTSYSGGSINIILDTQNSQGRMPMTPFLYLENIAAGNHVVAFSVYNAEVDNIPLTVKAGSALEVIEFKKGAI